MTILKHKAGTSTPALYIWAETANINYFLSTALTPVSAGGVQDKISNVSAHSRRQYPGDATPINVASSVREYVFDPGARNGSALPGKPFILIADYGLPAEEKRQFTYQGRFLDLHGFLSNNVKFQVRLYSSTGKRYIIDAPAP